MKVRLEAVAAMLGLAALVGTAPAQAEIVRSTDNSFVTKHEVTVTATPKEVWLALISPSRWWQAAHTWSGDAKNLTLTPQAGGCFCERIPEVDEPGRFTLEGSVEHMRIVQAYPEQALRLVGSLGPLQSEPVTGVLTIALSKVEQGTRIVWEYNVGGPMRYEVPVISKAVDGVMAAQIGALGKLLGVAAIPPAPAAAPAPAPAVPPAASAPRQGGTTPSLAKPPAAMPAQAPATPRAGPAAAPVKVSPKPAAAQVTTGSGAASATKGIATGAGPKPAAAPPKPTAKSLSVEDVFGDLEDKPQPKPQPQPKPKP